MFDDGLVQNYVSRMAKALVPLDNLRSVIGQ
jgi:hypothetical protein